MIQEYFVGLLGTLAVSAVLVPIGAALHLETVARRDRLRPPSTYKLNEPESEEKGIARR